MSRILARRGASVLVAAALLGGSLALGGGTASAEGLPGGSLEAVEPTDLPALLSHEITSFEAIQVIMMLLNPSAPGGYQPGIG